MIFFICYDTMKRRGGSLPLEKLVVGDGNHFGNVAVYKIIKSAGFFLRSW